MRYRGWPAFALIGILFLCNIALNAQSVQSTILGTVKDQGDAVILDAQVTITNVDTGISAAYTTDASGNFQAFDLPPGRYRVQAAKDGFQKKVISDLTLAARQQLRLDVILPIGATQQEVTVDAGAVGAIETETPAIASTLDTQSVMSLPVNTRASGSTSPLSMVQALPGVQADNGLNFSVQGAQPFQTETSVDGISTQNATSNSPIADAFPSSESIAEVRADGVSNSAEFGQPGEITTVSKNGTNRLHGSLFWYHQNRALDAVAYGTPHDPVTGKVEKPQKIGNDFGVSAGGPVVIPHLYNGHDKTFFFGTYEGFRFPKQSTIQNLVPTQAMVNGDFSKEIPFDPADPNTWLWDYNNVGPYPGNIIPSISSSAQPFLSLLPAPNVGQYQTISDAESGLGYNYADNRDSSYHSNQFDARLDHRFNQKLQGFARYTFKDVSSLGPQDLLLPSIAYFDHFRILASSLTYTITPNLLDEFRFGFTNEQNGNHNMINGGPYTADAKFNAVAQNYPLNGMTGLFFASGFTNISAGGTDSTSQSHLYQYTDNLTWVKRAHTLKYGADIRSLEAITTLGAYGLNNIEVFAFTGLTGYSPMFMGVSQSPMNQLGTQFADLLAGVPSYTAYYGLIPENDAKTINYGFYAQDQWRIRPNLTLIYGLRYELHPPYHDAKGAIGNFDPSVAQTGRVIYPAGYKNLLDPNLMASFDGCGYGPAVSPYAACTPVLSSSEAHLPSSLRQSQKDRFLPRIGLAWRPFNDDKTAVRAGFGVYQTTLMGKTFFAMTDSLQAASLNFYNDLDFSSGAPVPLYMWPQTSPGGAAAPPSYGTQAFNTANSIQQKDPYSMQWNLSVDRQLPADIGLRVSYIAMKTDQLSWSQNLNDMSYSSTTPAKSRPLTDRPFPNWNTVNANFPGAQANYHSMQVELDHRMQHGLTLQSTYTLAKNLADNQGAMATSFAGEDGYSGGGATYRFDRRLDYGDVNGTRRNRWLTTAVYELPFGHGRQFGANANRLADAVIGGWQLSSIFLWQTGPYLTAYIPGQAADPSGTGSGSMWGRAQRPDIVGKIDPAHRSRSQWVNPKAFACPSNSGYTDSSYAGNACSVGVDSTPIGRFGNEHVGSVVGPGTVNLSGGLSKRFEITENVHLRAEGTFTNALNHTNLNDPQLDITNPNFGKITSSRGSDFGGNRTGQVSMRLEF